MKNMRKLASLLLALVMVFAMATTAFAADNGSITINKATDGEQYQAYKLFDLTYVEGTDAVSYTYTKTGDTDELYNALTASGSPFKLTETAATGVYSVVANGTQTAETIAAWLESNLEVLPTPTEVTAANGVASFTAMDYGYYYVTSDVGSVVILDSTAPSVTIDDKNTPPTLDKEISEVDNATTNVSSDKEKALAEIGDVVEYSVTITAQKGALSYVFTDTLSNGLTLDASSVKVDGALYSGSNKVDNVTANATSVTGNSIKITFAQSYLDTITTATPIVITYSATVNSSAVIGTEGNSNTAKLQYGNEPSVNELTDDAKVYSAQFSVEKTDGEKALAGAGFVLRNSDNKYYNVDDNGVVSWVDTIDSAKEYISDSTDNNFDVVFKGLTAGTYTLIEKTVPAGYNKAGDVTFTITNENNDADDKVYTDNVNLIQSATVVNNSGSELPSTGGMGTTLFYIVGGILVVAAIVLLVTKKRMAAE